MLTSEWSVSVRVSFISISIIVIIIRGRVCVSAFSIVIIIRIRDRVRERVMQLIPKGIKNMLTTEWSSPSAIKAETGRKIAVALLVSEEEL
jgi:hypothetical protein